MDKKELKQQYKEQQPPMGCYALVCNSSNEMFIGTALNLQAKRNALLFQLNAGVVYSNPHLQALFKEQGEQGFTFRILEELKYQDDVLDYRSDLKTMKELYLEANPGSKELLV